MTSATLPYPTSSLYTSLELLSFPSTLLMKDTQEQQQQPTTQSESSPDESLLIRPILHDKQRCTTNAMVLCAWSVSAGDVEPYLWPTPDDDVRIIDSSGAALCVVPLFEENLVDVWVKYRHLFPTRNRTGEEAGKKSDEDAAAIEPAQQQQQYGLARGCVALRLPEYASASLTLCLFSRKYERKIVGVPLQVHSIDRSETEERRKKQQREEEEEEAAATMSSPKPLLDELPRQIKVSARDNKYNNNKKQNDAGGDDTTAILRLHAGDVLDISFDRSVLFGGCVQLRPCPSVGGTNDGKYLWGGASTTTGGLSSEDLFSECTKATNSYFDSCWCVETLGEEDNSYSTATSSSWAALGALGQQNREDDEEQEQSTPKNKQQQQVVCSFSLLIPPLKQSHQQQGQHKKSGSAYRDFRLFYVKKTSLFSTIPRPVACSKILRVNTTSSNVLPTAVTVDVAEEKEDARKLLLEHVARTARLSCTPQICFPGDEVTITWDFTPSLTTATTTQGNTEVDAVSAFASLLSPMDELVFRTYAASSEPEEDGGEAQRHPQQEERGDKAASYAHTVCLGKAPVCPMRGSTVVRAPCDTGLYDLLYIPFATQTPLIFPGYLKNEAEPKQFAFGLRVIDPLCHCGLRFPRLPVDGAALSIEPPPRRSSNNGNQRETLPAPRLCYVTYEVSCSLAHPEDYLVLSLRHSAATRASDGESNEEEVVLGTYSLQTSASYSSNALSSIGNVSVRAASNRLEDKYGLSMIPVLIGAVEIPYDDVHAALAAIKNSSETTRRVTATATTTPTARQQQQQQQHEHAVKEDLVLSVRYVSAGLGGRIMTETVFSPEEISRVYSEHGFAADGRSNDDDDDVVAFTLDLLAGRVVSLRTPNFIHRDGAARIPVRVDIPPFVDTSTATTSSGDDNEATTQRNRIGGMLTDVLLVVARASDPRCCAFSTVDDPRSCPHLVLNDLDEQTEHKKSGDASFYRFFDALSSGTVVFFPPIPAGTKHDKGDEFVARLYVTRAHIASIIASSSSSSLPSSSAPLVDLAPFTRVCIAEKVFCMRDYESASKEAAAAAEGDRMLHDTLDRFKATDTGRSMYHWSQSYTGTPSYLDQISSSWQPQRTFTKVSASLLAGMPERDAASFIPAAVGGAGFFPHRRYCLTVKQQLDAAHRAFSEEYSGTEFADNVRHFRKLSKLSDGATASAPATSLDNRLLSAREKSEVAVARVAPAIRHHPQPPASSPTAAGSKKRQQSGTAGSSYGAVRLYGESEEPAGGADEATVETQSCLSSPPSPSAHRGENSDVSPPPLKPSEPRRATGRDSSLAPVSLLSRRSCSVQSAVTDTLALFQQHCQYIRKNDDNPQSSSTFPLISGRSDAASDSSEHGDGKTKPPPLRRERADAQDVVIDVSPLQQPNGKLNGAVVVTQTSCTTTDAIVASWFLLASPSPSFGGDANSSRSSDLLALVTADFSQLVAVKPAHEDSLATCTDKSNNKRNRGTVLFSPVEACGSYFVLYCQQEEEAQEKHTPVATHTAHLVSYLVTVRPTICALDTGLSTVLQQKHAVDDDKNKNKRPPVAASTVDRYYESSVRQLGVIAAKRTAKGFESYMQQRLEYMNSGGGSGGGSLKVILVGCSYLMTPHELKGPENDVRALEIFFRDVLGLASENVVVLRETFGDQFRRNAKQSQSEYKRPTCANIRAALRRVVDSCCCCETTVLFYFSGYGALQNSVFGSPLMHAGVAATHAVSSAAHTSATASGSGLSHTGWYHDHVAVTRRVVADSLLPPRLSGFSPSPPAPVDLAPSSSSSYSTSAADGAPTSTTTTTTTTYGHRETNELCKVLLPCDFDWDHRCIRYSDLYELLVEPLRRKGCTPFVIVDAAFESSDFDTAKRSVNTTSDGKKEHTSPSSANKALHQGLHKLFKERARQLKAVGMPAATGKAETVKKDEEDEGEGEHEDVFRSTVKSLLPPCGFSPMSSSARSVENVLRFGVAPFFPFAYPSAIVDSKRPLSSVMSLPHSDGLFTAGDDATTANNYADSANIVC